MKTKYWNWIYFIGFLLPVVAYIGQFVTVALSDGNAPLVLTGAWSTITGVVNLSGVNGLMPVTQMAKVIVGSNSIGAYLAGVSPVACFTIGCDFVLWLGIMHLVLDVFMLLTNCLSKLFNKFGGAD